MVMNNFTSLQIINNKNKNVSFLSYPVFHATNYLYDGYNDSLDKFNILWK